MDNSYNIHKFKADDSKSHIIKHSNRVIRYYIRNVILKPGEECDIEFTNLSSISPFIKQALYKRRNPSQYKRGRGIDFQRILL